MTDKTQLLREALESYEHAIANGHREHDALSAFANISVPDLARAALSAQPASGEVVGFAEAHMSYVRRFGGICRDCADVAGICPRSGLPCDGDKKAIQSVFDALAYGVGQGFIASPFATPPASQEQAQPSGEVVAWLIQAIGTSQFEFAKPHQKAIHKNIWTDAFPVFRGISPQPAQPAARVAMTDGAKRALISNFFSEGWAQDAAMNLLHDFERGITSNGATDAGAVE